MAHNAKKNVHFSSNHAYSLASTAHFIGGSPSLDLIYKIRFNDFLRDRASISISKVCKIYELNLYKACTLFVHTTLCLATMCARTLDIPTFKQLLQKRPHSKVWVSI